MDSANKDVTEEEKLELQVHLESVLRRKVSIESATKLNSSVPDRQDSNKEISYKVWIYDKDYFSNNRQNDIISNRHINLNNQKYVKFKLGQISIEELNDSGQFSNNIYTAIQVRANVSKSQSFYVDSDPAFIKELKLPQNDSNDCYYLHQKQNETQSKETQKHFNHWYAIKNINKLLPLFSVKFKVDTAEMKCIKGCQVPSDNLKFCYNDNKYFCNSCDDTFHNGSPFESVKNHKRLNAMTFTINYQGNCKNHLQKPYEFFCVTCKAALCIKDIQDGKHKGEGHDIKYLDDVYKSFDHEKSALDERIKLLRNNINTEMTQRDKHSKEVQKKYTEAKKNLDDRLLQAYEKLHKEIINRCTYLASLSLELQRINTEIESKAAFIKAQQQNADYATYISMATVFNNYIKSELIPNMELLININYDSISSGLFEMKKKDGESGR